MSKLYKSPALLTIPYSLSPIHITTTNMIYSSRAIVPPNGFLPYGGRAVAVGPPSSPPVSARRRLCVVDLIVDIVPVLRTTKAEPLRRHRAYQGSPNADESPSYLSLHPDPCRPPSSSGFPPSSYPRRRRSPCAGKQPSREWIRTTRTRRASSVCVGKGHAAGPCTHTKRSPRRGC
ncbi:hypothetical protein C8F01DRAFT_1295634 [Mycena amicta]|nr:hypothetical protein C8F01DRAFT_1295634 [Mycena amicta]